MNFLNKELDSIIKRVKEVDHGFKEMVEVAQEFHKKLSSSELFSLAKKLFQSDSYQAQMTATLMIGYLAPASSSALSFLKEKVSKNDNWRVQEMLAKAFDFYAASIGYEKAIPIIKEWLGDKTPNVRRAVTEGLRIWTSRSYFKQHPEIAIELLSKLKKDESEYVRKSVGNALRDISRKHKEIIQKEITTWDLTNKNIKQVYQLASKFL